MHPLGFVLNGKVDTTVHTLMRQIIAMEVASDLDTYNEAMLGKPNVEYCNWIQQPSSWGGAIEVREAINKSTNKKQPPKMCVCIFYLKLNINQLACTGKNLSERGYQEGASI